MNLGTRPGGAAEAVRDRRALPCTPYAPPEGELHGLAAPDWRGEIYLSIYLYCCRISFSQSLHLSILSILSIDVSRSNNRLRSN
jgi:hypothetical protein